MNSEARKPNYQKIWRFLDDLKSQSWLGYRTSWTDYLFHLTHVENLANIFETGYLLSRREVKRQGKLKVDAASKEILGKNPGLFDLVRLYFRPRTPTTYHMEGIKSKSSRKYREAHCSIPVYLLFDLRDILALNETGFSRGSLANGHIICKDSDEFSDMPFQSIYGDWYSGIWPEDTDVRHAEVVFPKKLPLKYLRRILCRSQAEFDTLRHLCQENKTWDRWKPIISVCTSPKLFERKWLFIDDVKLGETSMQIRFHLPKQLEHKGPFYIVLRVSNRDKTYTLRRVIKADNVIEKLGGSRYSWTLPDKNRLLPYNLLAYDFDVTIEDELAYKGSLD